MNKFRFLVCILFFLNTQIILSQVETYSVSELNEDFNKGNFINISNHNDYIKNNIIPSVKSDSELNNILIYLFSANEAIGKNHQALEYAEMYVELCRNSLPSKSIAYGAGLNECIKQSLIIGDDEKALHYSNLGIALLDSNYLTKIEVYIYYLENAASIQISKGDISSAKENYLKLNIIYSKQLPDKNEEYYSSKIMLGTCYFISAQFAQAESIMEECIDYFKHENGNEYENELYRSSLNMLFGCYVMTNKIQKAAEIRDECFNLSEKYLGKTSKPYADVLTVGALYYNVLGEQCNKSSDKDSLKLSMNYFNKSIELASASIKILNKSADFTNELEELNGNIALSYYFLKEYQKGLKFAESSNNQAVKTFYYLRLNQVDKADSVFMSFIKTRDESFKKLNTSIGNEDQLYLKSRQFSLDNIGLMNYTKLRGDQNPKLVEFCFSNWLNFNGSINNQYTDLIKLIAESGNSNINQKYTEFKRLKSALSSLYQSKSTPLNTIQIESLEDSLVLIDQQLNQFYSVNNMNKTYSTMDIKNLLKEDEAYVEIVKVPTFDFLKGKITDSIDYYVFIIQKEIDIPLKQLFLENGNELEDILIMEYAKNTNGKNIENSDLDVTSYNAFWKPIADQIKDKNKIYVSMGGVYNSINIQTLYNPETSNYLSDEKDIQIVNSGRSFIQSKTKPETIYSHNTAILMGFPNYNDSLMSTSHADLIAYSRDLKPDISDSTTTRGGFSLTNLPGTKTEVEAIGKSMASNKWDVNVLIANQATETILKNSNSPRVLHIATHGYFMNNLASLEDADSRLMGMNKEKVIENSLLQTGLFFAGANQTLKGNSIYKVDNGILTAYEASCLDLRETELVVLSACETGRGEVKNGEGVYGLRKAFADAGAKNIIMSLWKVDDKVTQEFMTSFYSNWLNNKSTIRVAFNKTQQDIKAKYPQPYYWGAFILVGE